MLRNREAEDKLYRESTTDYLSSDDEELEENFSWFQEADPDTYFCFCTRTRTAISKDEQIYICYGRRSNRYLLSAYGFLLEQNKYNALTFRVWLDFREGQG